MDDDAVYVQCYTIPPKAAVSPLPILPILPSIHNFPFRFILAETLPVQPYQPPPYQCQNYWHLGHPAKHCHSTALYEPILDMIDQTALHSHA